MIELKLLGRAELRGNDGELEHSFLAGPKRLALLAYLVLNQPTGFQRRDRILPLLWPEKGQKSGRNSLSNLLYHIRKALGSDILITRGTEELGIDRSKLYCDALEFEQFIEEDKMLKAAELYRSDLLDGLHVPDASQKFDQWLDQERNRFQKLYGNVLETLAETDEKRGKFKEAARWWLLKTQEFPFDTRVVRRLTDVLASSGNRAEAVRKAEQHAEFLQQELGIDHRETMNELTYVIENAIKKTRYQSADQLNKLEQRDFKSIAILPFEELGTHEDTSSFAGGLHNDLLTRLSGVLALHVISRTSVLQYLNTSKNIPQIAEELGVGTVVEGSIQFNRGRLRLNIQLIDVKKDKHIWAETFDREFTVKHYFDIQSELALKITDSLKARLSPAERERVVEWAPTDDLEAHRLYTYGRRQLDKRTEMGIKRSAEYFRSAVEQDPDYALAWVGLADALALQYDYGYSANKKLLSEAEKSIENALSIDSNLAEAYASLGLLNSNRHCGVAAIRNLKNAVELQPSYAEAQNWLSWNYQLLGKPVKALESAQKAVNLNPLSPEAVSNLSCSYLYNGYPEKALSEALRNEELQPDWGTPKFYRGLALFELGKFAEAKHILDGISTPWAGNGPETTLALCHIMTNDTDKAEKIQKELEEKGDIFSTGLIHAALGNADRALELFMQVEYWDDWETLAIHHLYTNILDSLKEDSKFKEIRNKVLKSRGS